MRLETKNLLVNKYNSLSYKCKETALKCYFQYNKIHVNIYFDNYDFDAPNMHLLLKSKTESYFTALSIHNNLAKKEYLNRLPWDIRKQIIDNNNSLDGFFDAIEQKILEGHLCTIFYSKDDFFKKEIRRIQQNRVEKDFNFIDTIIRGSMSIEMEKWLYENSSINAEIAKKIKAKGYTFRRTADFNKRKCIRIILRDKGVVLDK